VEASAEAGIEAMKERWHRRSERNPKLAKAAKEFHGTTCMICGFNFQETYGEIGAGRSSVLNDEAHGPVHLLKRWSSER
jgi:predicted HNH restriction endonuclease